MPAVRHPTTSRDEAPTKATVQLEVETSLNFDRLILLGAGRRHGAAPARWLERSARHGQPTSSPRAMVGTVAVHGEPGRAVRIDLPRADRAPFAERRPNHVRRRRQRPAVAAAARFGRQPDVSDSAGACTISGDAEGDYRGDLPITAEYL